MRTFCSLTDEEEARAIERSAAPEESCQEEVKADLGLPLY